MSKGKIQATDILKRHVMPNLAYLIVFWFANTLGMAYRIAPGENLINKLIGITETLNIAMARILPSFDIFDIIIGAVGTVFVYAIVQTKRKNAQLYRKDIEYGSARWSA